MVLYINILVLSELIFTTTQMEKSQVIRLFSSGTFWQTGSLFIKQHIYLFPPIYSIFHISRGCGTEGQMSPLTKFQILLFNRFLPKNSNILYNVCPLAPSILQFKIVFAAPAYIYGQYALVNDFIWLFWCMYLSRGEGMIFLGGPE